MMKDLIYVFAIIAVLVGILFGYALILWTIDTIDHWFNGLLNYIKGSSGSGTETSSEDSEEL